MTTTSPQSTSHRFSRSWAFRKPDLAQSFVEIGTASSDSAVSEMTAGSVSKRQPTSLIYSVEGAETVPRDLRNEGRLAAIGFPAV